MFGQAATLKARPSQVPHPSSCGPGGCWGPRTHADPQRLRLDVEPGARDGLLHVPASYDPAQPSPLLVFLHGASSGGKDCEHVFNRSELEAGRVILMLPDSRGRTWDVIRGGFGPDVQYIDRALSKVFQRYNVDPNRICCGGFSDGASYALSLGLPSGGTGLKAWSSQQQQQQQQQQCDPELFTHVMALSSGFMTANTKPAYLPHVFISHGVQDEVLDIDRCSRRIVPKLALMGFTPPCSPTMNSPMATASRQGLPPRP